VPSVKPCPSPSP